MIGVGLIAALFVVALAVFASTFDINHYRDRIVQAVMDETGRTITFRDDLGLEFFPGVGVKLGGVSLSNSEEGGIDPMVEVRSARVSVRILPLLKGDIKFGPLELDGLRLHLSRSKAGVGNWADLVGREAKPVAVEKAEGNNSFSLDIDGVTITDASLFWDDEQTDTHIILSGIDLETGRIFKGAPFPVTASLSFQCAQPDMRGKLKLTSKSSLDIESREYSHMDMKLSLDAEGKDLPGGKAKGELALQFAAFDFNKENAQITGLVVSAYGATVRVDGSLEGITDGVNKILATVTASPMDAKKTFASLGMDVPVTTDPAALTTVGGMAEVTYVPGDVHFKSFQLDLDGSRIKGRARYITDPIEPFYFARLDVGELDLDRYLPPDHAEKKQQAKDAVEAGRKDDRIIDSKALRRLHTDIEANITKLRVKSMLLENVTAKLKARHGIVRFSPLSASMYGGTLSGGVTINVTQQYPKTDLIVGLNKINIDNLSKDVMGDDSYMGILDFNGAASCQGERVQSMLRTMNGKLNIHLADGKFPGVNLIGMTKKAHENKEKGGEVVATKTDSTQFGSIQGSGIIQAGIFKNKDLEIKAPGLRADGYGTIVLPTRRIDYLLKAKLVATSEGQGGKSSDDLYGVMVPIWVAGTLDNPRYWVSVSEYVKALGGAVLRLPEFLLGGAVDVIKGVGSVVTGDCCEEDKKIEEEPKRKKFLGIF